MVEEIQQVINPAGEVVGEVPDLPVEELVGYYRWMVLGREFSGRMVVLQRQGRIGTFAPLNGQEASVAIAAPLQPEDWLVGSYREILAYFLKGVPLVSIMERYRGYVTANYPADVHCLPMQIVLGTQMLHGVGLAMAIKYDGKPNVAVAVCGDGATSEGDFNEALNFAGVFRVPVVIVVQNNGWAISTPRHRQSATERIAHRGPGFGMPGYLVDGNDVLAVYQVMAECVARARAGDGPSLVELVTYRMGAHTTADDPHKYRPEAELEEWRRRDPITRYRQFLLKGGMMTDVEDEQLHEEVVAEIQAAIEFLESQPPQGPDQLFDLVYVEPPPQLEEQRRAILSPEQGEA
jgi:pyruvate dehydrogenase E1 component alpha subunit